jgi:hypothetical protein
VTGHFPQQIHPFQLFQPLSRVTPRKWSRWYRDTPERLERSEQHTFPSKNTDLLGTAVGTPLERLRSTVKAERLAFDGRPV